MKTLIASLALLALACGCEKVAPRVDDLTARVEKLSQRVEQLKVENLTLSHLCDSLTTNAVAAHAVQQALINSLSNNIVQQNAEFGARKKAMEAITDRLGKLEGSASKADNQLSALAAKAGELADTLDLVNAANVGLQELSRFRFEIMTNRFGETETQIAELTAQIGPLARVDQVNTVFANLQHSETADSEALAKLHAALAEYEVKIEAVQKDLARHNGELTELKTSIAAIANKLPKAP